MNSDFHLWNDWCKMCAMQGTHMNEPALAPDDTERRRGCSGTMHLLHPSVLIACNAAPAPTKPLFASGSVGG